ncbi:MAG: hypothetical protein C0439_06325 [Pseudomonas sp.]|nr:hypothetical protein [Pseudomonas sp.]
MGASITLAGADLIAQKHIAQEGLDVVQFVFANVPGLDHSGPVDRAAGMPDAGQIVYTATIPAENKGYVTPHQVVYSVQVGSDVGDWDFNWIGLKTAEGVLFAVSYVPLQQKRRNIPPLQLGNNLTRNFLVVFDGAQALTGVTIDASTWQHDFTVRLAGIDERERQSNRDIFGRACFFGSALQLEKVGAVYQLKPGTAYVEGVRLQRSASLAVVPPAFPTTAWLDVALQRELNDVVASWSVAWGAGKVDYVDSAGVQHYCVAIADLPNSNTITDSRPVENIAGPLVAHFAARVGDYAGLRARATTKDDVGLGNLPNAKSDDTASNSSDVLATTKAISSHRQEIVTGDHAQMRARSTTKGDVGLGNLPNAKSDDPDSNDSEILATTKALHKALERLAVPFAALPFPTIATADNRLPATVGASPGYGGIISVPVGVRLALAEEVEAGATGRMRSFTSASWSSANLAANKTYYLRATVTAGALTFYTQQGTDSDSIPATLKGTPDAAAGGGFDSTVLDALIARIQTGAAGSSPTLTLLANAAVLKVKSVAYDTVTRTTQTFNLAAKRITDLELNWARKPSLHSARFDYSINGQLIDPEDMRTYYSGSVSDASGTLTAVVDRYKYAPVALMDANLTGNLTITINPLTTDFSVMA